MAIKKPLIKNRSEEVDEEEPAPKKLLKKRAPEPVEEEEKEEEEEEKEEEEEEEPAKKFFKKKGAEKSKSKKSFADMFDSTKPGRGLMPVGDHKMYVSGFELDGEIAEEGEEQGALKAKVTYEGHEDEDDGVAGKSISQWYGLADEDGEPLAGIPFLKGDLDVLGYEDVQLADLEEIFEQIVSERIEVIIKVKQNGQYTNAYLQGLADGE